MKLNIGSGDEELEGWTSLDRAGSPNILADLEQGIPLRSSSIHAIRARHVLEHITNLIPLIKECWRVLRPGASLFIEVPCAWDPELTWRDPGHVRAFVSETFYYWEKDRKGGYDPWWNIEKVDIVSESCHLVIHAVMSKPAE